MKPIKLYPLQGNKSYIFSDGCKLANEDTVLADFLAKQKGNLLSTRSDLRSVPFVVCAGVGDGVLLCDTASSHLFFVLEANDGYFTCGAKKNVAFDVSDAATFNTLKLKNGDYFTVPAGTVYSVGKGVSYVEVYSKNTDLHRINNNGDLEGMEAPYDIPLLKKPAMKNDADGYSVKVLSATESFTAAQITVVGSYQNSIGSAFRFIFCLDGGAKLICSDGKIDLRAGDCYLLPAGMGDYTVKGGVDLLVFSR